MLYILVFLLFKELLKEYNKLILCGKLLGMSYYTEYSKTFIEIYIDLDGV